MRGLFYTVLEISVPVSVIILVVLLFSKWFSKKFTAKWRYLVWLVLAIRLIIPLNFHAQKTVVNVIIPDTPAVTVRMTSKKTATAVSEPVTETKQTEKGYGSLVKPEKNANSKDAGTEETFSLPEAASVLWILVAVFFMVYQLSKYFVFQKNIMRWSCLVEDTDSCTAFLLVLRNMKIKRNIALRRSKKISSPMMTGFFRPILFLPETNYSREELEMIIRHELVHYKHRDIWYKFIIALANAVHWFNPLVWVMSREASKDVEMACDAEVIKGMDAGYRKKYGETILSAMHKGEKCKTAFSTYFYGGVKTMKKRIKNIFDTSNKRRGIAALCVVAIAAVVLGIFVAYGTKSPQPKLKVTVGNSKAAISINGLDKADGGSMFVPVMKETSADKIPTASEGIPVKLSFDDQKPDSVTVTDILLKDDGTHKYNKGIKPENIKSAEKNGIYTFTIKKNMSSYLNSNYPEKGDIYGYCITAKLGNKSYFYPFVLKMGVNDTKTIKYGRFEITVPKTWELSGNILKSGGKNMCELNAIDYDPDQPFSQLYGNHSEEKSKEQITGTSYPTTKVVLRRTQPAAIQDDSYTDELHYFVIPQNGRAAYDLNFNSSEVSGSEAFKIVKTFQLLSSEIIENVNSDIVKQNPSIDITNEFISYDDNYIALFGSLKSDKTQGAAVVYAVDKPANKKQLLAPGKHGAVRAVQTGAKSSTVDIAADDGYEWVFNVFNGFM